MLNARKVLDEYGGAFSRCRRVGQTYMSACWRSSSTAPFGYCPPQLLDRDKRGSWPNVFSDFQIRQTDFESIGKLDRLLERDLSKYTNIFIDESHRFRTETTHSYEALARFARQTVIGVGHAIKQQAARYFESGKALSERQKQHDPEPSEPRRIFRRTRK
jgi:hypothetical protein